MELNFINQENVNLYSFSNIEAMKFPINSIAISLHGWYETKMRERMTYFEAELARNHVLCIYPYYSEWSWANFPTINLIDGIVDYYIKHYKLSEDIPTVVFGKSLGGLTALIYTLYSRRTPVACAANCPICDLPFQIQAQPDMLRTIYSAYGGYNIPLKLAVELHSPIQQITKMPRIPYYIVHGKDDFIVNKIYHSDPYVKKMKELDYDIIYHEVEGMTHCDFKKSTEEKRSYQDFILTHSLLR